MQESMQFMNMLCQAMKDEKMAVEFYENLMKLAPYDCKHSIKHIMEDEQKHYEMLACMYQMLTGRHPEVNGNHPEMPKSYMEGLNEAFYSESEAMEFYRTMYLMTCNMEFRDILFEIMTDEMDHAARINHCCCMMCHKPMPPMPPSPPPMPPMPPMPPPFPKPPKG